MRIANKNSIKLHRTKAVKLSYYKSDRVITDQMVTDDGQSCRKNIE